MNLFLLLAIPFIFVLSFLQEGNYYRLQQIYQVSKLWTVLILFKSEFAASSGHLENIINKKDLKQKGSYGKAVLTDKATAISDQYFFIDTVTLSWRNGSYTFCDDS